MSFKAVASKISKKEGIPKAEADAELAASTRRASPAAKKKNPALKKVKGKAKKITTSPTIPQAMGGY